MAFGGKITLVGVMAFSMLSFFHGCTCHFIPQSAISKDAIDTMKTDEGRAIAGRIVSVPVKVYMQAFKASLKLGQCPLVMQDGSIKLCKDEFEGEEVYLPKGSMTVDVSKVQSSEDILSHGMGGVGASVGVLGIISVSPKVSVAVNTDTDKNALNLLSSYEMKRGVLTLHRPRVKHIQGNTSLFLSEIELGGNELLLVTLKFESEEKKVEVAVSVTVKILFISITAKLNYMNKTFKSKASCTIQFKSSWREEITVYYSSLEQCIPRVKEIEDMYMKGPQELRDMNLQDERMHNLYHFSSWKGSPYGSQFNLALINHDLEFLTEQNTEIKAVIQRINKLKDQPWPSTIKREIIQLNQTLSDKTQKLTSGLDKYHEMTSDDRQLLRDIYGHTKAPYYYQRYLNKIIAS